MARADDYKPPALPDAGGLSVDESLEVLVRWLDALYSDGVFNGTVLIAKDGDVRFQRHYGYADLAKQVPLSAQSSFSLASVSKPFTAFGILLLARQGKLKLDDRLAQYVPEVAPYDRITIRHLLHHTSGIPDHIELADREWPENLLLTMPDMIGMFAKHPPRAYFAPGDMFEYSNTGYAFLGEIIARVSRWSYPVFMAETIFKPLGMKNTAAYNLALKDCPLPERVYGMRRQAGRVEKSDLNMFDGIFGDGGIYASAEDLVRWDAALRAGTLLPCEEYEQAYEPGRLNNGKATEYGFGWELAPANVVEHWGEWEGFAAHMRRDLRQNALLVALSNLGPAKAVDPIFTDLAVFVGRITWSGGLS
jgi:CubicO group peptidase (beta-lactamase class C family)